MPYARPFSFLIRPASLTAHVKIPLSELHPLHHRSTSRRLSRLLRASDPADTAYRFDCGAWDTVPEILRRESGLHAEPRHADDRPHAGRPWGAVQRHSAVAGVRDLRRSAA